MKFVSINEYVSSLPENAQKAMSEIIATIKAKVPRCQSISYNMPAFKVNGEYFVHFSVEKSYRNVSYSGGGMKRSKSRSESYRSAKSSA